MLKEVLIMCILWKGEKWMQRWLWYLQLLNPGGQWILVISINNRRNQLWDVCWEIRDLPIQSPPSCSVVTVPRGVVSSCLPFVQLLQPIKSMLTKGQDPASIDCAGSSHVMGDLWPLSPLWFLAWECSCGESWHSFPVGQDTISLHCKECNTICNDWTTDNNNLCEKHFFPLFLNGNAPLAWKTVMFPLPTR